MRAPYSPSSKMQGIARIRARLRSRGRLAKLLHKVDPAPGKRTGVLGGFGGKIRHARELRARCLRRCAASARYRTVVYGASSQQTAVGLDQTRHFVHGQRCHPRRPKGEGDGRIVLFAHQRGRRRSGRDHPAPRCASTR